jgi:hypothetical protein
MLLRGAERMPLYWLCYRHNNQVSVVIERGACWAFDLLV